MSTLRSSPFNLVKDSNVIVKYSAINILGESDLSPESGTPYVKIATIPNNPSSAPVVLEYSEQSITIEMPAMTAANNGGSDITSYVLFWDNGLNGIDFTSLIGENSLNLIRTFTATGLTSGHEYQFKYKVRNAHGYSVDFSPLTT